MFINNFDPVAFEIFSLEIRWYSFAYIMGILIGWYLAKRIFINYKIVDKFDDYVTYMIIGLIAGGRLGYVLLYNFDYYLNDILSIFKVWQGGMSFHGAVIGVTIASILFSKKNNDNTFEYLDVVALVAPIGIFFGRIANFINSELYGSITTVPWAVKFVKIDNLYRHPSQLYEATLEGVLLFFIMVFFWKKINFQIPGKLSAIFLIVYSFFRFVVEYFREPDVQIGYLFMNLTMGQLICCMFFIAGLFLYNVNNNDKEKT